jgi:hypothetical protein
MLKKSEKEILKVQVRKCVKETPGRITHISLIKVVCLAIRSFFFFKICNFQETTCIRGKNRPQQEHEKPCFRQRMDTRTLGENQISQRQAERNTKIRIAARPSSISDVNQHVSSTNQNYWIIFIS